MSAPLPSTEATLGTAKEAPAGRRELTKAANRQAILDAAKIVFAELGFEATTVRDIIRRTELASGTFYNYFRSKEEIFEALTDDSAGRFRPILRQIRSEAADFEEYIRRAIAAYFTFIAADHEPMAALAARSRSTVGVRVDTPEMLAVFEQVKTDMTDVLVSHGHTGFDADYFAAASVGIAREVGDRMLLRQPFDVAGASQFAADMLVSGVRALLTSAPKAHS